MLCKRISHEARRHALQEPPCFSGHVGPAAAALAASHVENVPSAATQQRRWVQPLPIHETSVKKCKQIICIAKSCRAHSKCPQLYNLPKLCESHHPDAECPFFSTCLRYQNIFHAVQAAPLRYKVQEIIQGEYEKQLVVVEAAEHGSEGSGRAVRVHLQDGWMDTPAEIGDLVHVLAELHAGEQPEAMQHATCNSCSGKPERTFIRSKYIFHVLNMHSSCSEMLSSQNSPQY